MCCRPSKWLAAILVFVVDGHTARTAGLSIVFPGGGFLYVANPILFVLSGGAVFVALVLGWGVSCGRVTVPLTAVVGHRNLPTNGQVNAESDQLARTSS